MKKNIKSILEVIVIAMFIIALALWFAPLDSVLPTEQGDTHIQQVIHFKVSFYDPNKDYYIHTYIEVYNNGWEEATGWYDYAAVDEVVDIKVMRKLQAKEEAAKIGKVIREFYYGKESK